MVQTPNKTLTLTEFLALQETKPSLEYIDGQVIQKPTPQGKHSTKIYLAFLNYKL